MPTAVSHLGSNVLKTFGPRVCFQRKASVSCGLDDLSVCLLTGRWEERGHTGASEQVQFECMIPSELGLEPDGAILPPKDSNIIITTGCTMAMSIHVI